MRSVREMPRLPRASHSPTIYPLRTCSRIVSIASIALSILGLSCVFLIYCALPRAAMKITKVTEAGRQHLAVGTWQLALGSWHLALGTWQSDTNKRTATF